jgi:hypothetical protein
MESAVKAIHSSMIAQLLLTRAYVSGGLSNDPTPTNKAITTLPYRR